MHPEDTTDERLTALEIKATYTEDLVEQLEQVVVRQQQQIERLLRETSERRQPLLEGGLEAAPSLSENLPPHF